jgi:type I restriction enzyme M protein
MTGELKSKVNRVWDAFWSGGISNPIEVIEQVTYLLFIRRLDDSTRVRFVRGCDACVVSGAR